jgi:hypothetical protein
MVIHRTLREGDPTFREELLNYARNKGHVFNLAHFKDDSSPNGTNLCAILFCTFLSFYTPFHLFNKLFYSDGTLIGLNLQQINVMIKLI